MKIMTILGTRPEIIRLSLIIQKLDQHAGSHILVHTGQNFTHTLSDVFFQELKIRTPDYHLGLKTQSLGEQLGRMFEELEKIIVKEKPDRVLVLGDTNSALSAVLVERLGIPVFHMEAGNRCYDLSVPEEKNRRVIDSVSTFNLPYTPKSRENLLKEGVPATRIFVSGNPIFEVLTHYKNDIADSLILENLSLRENDYFLATIHRAENVDYEKPLKEIIRGLNLVAETYQKRIICSIHPRTRSKINQYPEIALNRLIEFYEPFGLFDFIKLQKNAFCVLTDSGTVQEESCLLHVPAVTVRNTTERPETVECGSNVVSGVKGENILKAVKSMVSQEAEWPYPEGYADLFVSAKVVKFILGGLGVVH
ncbi:UDP-N-acetylglucosamine 2-epimerase (non-hydrolyzing) [Peribacillus deserti]|uniref:UDP-N-acetylglucosamine 2-epimerase (Non-hydrolyzing) n=1 Tax=Peribacillus deserti TaxID=673318 RepID=A0ABS2QIT4_9BACI|nr:UDP-N-acetylglucosamine 2-epimerase (non-hydrolyzing) [Peribacillus deserti]MBM7693012.1 UDP-N-acetylglucosamine 2-epimerase (non-hydrolyzing) [Peribacillus deserti]